MPVEISFQAEEAAEQDALELLFHENGLPTLAGEVVGDFLDEVDWSAVLDDEEIAPFVERRTIHVKSEEIGEGDGAEVHYYTVPADTDGAQEIEVEYLSGDDMADAVDIDDLVGMFEHYLTQELPDETLEDRAKLAAVGILDIEETFKKGAFRKMHKAGGKDQVARMLVAMMKKEAIQRTAAGKGYKGGDYKKHPAGYSPGTPAGRKRHALYVKKSAAKIAAIKKKAGVKKGMKIAAKKAIKGKGGAAKLATKKRAKKGIAASDATTPASHLHESREGPAMAAALLGALGSQKDAQ